MIRFQFQAIRVDKNETILGQPRLQEAIKVDENAVILGQPSFQVLAIRVVENARTKEQANRFKGKYIEFFF